MQREHLLGGVAVLVVLAAGLSLIAVPGVLAEQSEPEPPGDLTLRETPITPANVTGDTATLTVTNWLAHRGGAMENVSLLVRTVDRDTGLITTRTRKFVGTIEKEGDVPVRANVTVERSGSYNIETLVFVDDQRVAVARSGVSGVAALKPDIAKSGLAFHRFEGRNLPTITYRIESAENGQVTMNARAFLTNGGSDTAGDLQVLIRARQSDSNIVADRAVVPVSDVRAGRTATPDVSLSVPDNYTYVLDAVLTRDDVIVDTESAVADLNPTREVEENTSTETVDIDAESFEQDTTAEAMDRTEEDDRYTTAAGEGPGFGPLVAVLAVASSALLLRRRTND